MAIGRISGSVLKSNLTRNGTDLAFETNLLYLDVTNSRIGIGTSEPTTTLQISGTTTTGGLTANGAVNIDGTGTSNMDNVIIGANTAAAVTTTSLVATTADINAGTIDNAVIGATTAAAITGTTIAGTTASLTNTSTGDSLLITTTENSSTAGPVITLKRNSGSPVDLDHLGQIKFLGENDADQEVVYGKITGKISDASDSTEDGTIEFANIKSGSEVVTARLNSDSLQLLNSTNLSVAGNTTLTGTLTFSGLTMPSSDGSNGQVLQTDGSGNISFAESSGGGGGNNTAVKQFSYFKLGQTSAVIDSFDKSEYRGAIYDLVMEDKDHGFTGHMRVSIVHDDTTPYISTYNVNEDSTRIADFTVAISGDVVELSAATNSSAHTNLRIYRVALGDHHETVANTNSKIIATSTNIGSGATTLDQFTKTDVRGAKYVILIKDDTGGDYQISEVSLTHDGTTVFHDTYGATSSRSTPPFSFSASISGSTVTLSGLSAGNTTGTAILYRQDLGSKTKLGEFDNYLYGIKADIDSAVETVDSFDVFKFKAARYFVTMESGSEYQNSEIIMTVNDAGTDATISESFVITADNTLATFSADVSSGKARLRASCNPDTKIYFARLAIEAENIYRVSGTSQDDLFIKYNNIDLDEENLSLGGTTGSLTLPKGSTGSRPSSAVTGMIRYNTDTDTYERYDTTGWVNIAKTATATEASGTTTGEKTSISTSAVNVDTFERTAFDSVFYQMVTLDEINNEIATQAVSLVHNDTAAFTSTGGIVRSGTNTQVGFDADFSGTTVRLRGTGTSDVNSVKFFRIGLGDNTTASSSGNTAFILNTDVDSATENLDTWSASSYRGAKYYISANNSSKTELTNIECLVVHNGTDAFITMYNDTFTGNNSLLSLSADINSGSVRLRASGNEPNTAVKMYRVLLGDSESDATSDNTKTVGQVSVSSSATEIDTFSTDSFNGAHYVIVGNSSSESAASISEVFVVADSEDAYVATGPQVSTKGTDQLTFTASLSGSTVTLSAASTSGASTTVNGFRVQLLRSQAGAATSLSVLTSNNQTITGQKTFTAGVLTDTIQSPGSNANITLDPQGTGKVDLAGNTILADSIELQFGTDTDANIKHTGTNLNVNETTGDINIRTYANDKDVVISTDDGSGGITEYIVADGSSGAVKLKHYGTTVFETTSTGASITNTSTSDALDITTTEDSSTAGPVINLKRNSSSVANADYLGQIKFQGENDADQEVLYAKISGKILDSADGSEDGILEFAFKKNGSNNISGRFRSDSLQLLNDTSLRVTGHVELGVLSGDPNTTTDIAHIYAKDESSSAEVFVRDEAGNVTKISPHNEKGEWEYFSRNTKTGKTVRVNMEEMIRDIEKLTGKKYIKDC